MNANHDNFQSNENGLTNGANINGLINDLPNENGLVGGHDHRFGHLTNQPAVDLALGWSQSELYGGLVAETMTI